MSFLIEYHKDQDIDAPFKNLKAASCVQHVAFSFLLIMQKDLSEWIDVSKIEIDDNILKEIK